MLSDRQKVPDDIFFFFPLFKAQYDISSFNAVPGFMRGGVIPLILTKQNYPVYIQFATDNDVRRYLFSKISSPSSLECL